MRVLGIVPPSIVGPAVLRSELENSITFHGGDLDAPVLIRDDVPEASRVLVQAPFDGLLVERGLDGVHRSVAPQRADGAVAADSIVPL